MWAATRNHLRRLAAVPTATSGGRAVATSPQTDQQGNKKSTWTKIKIFAPPLFFFWAGTDRVFSLREKTELVEKWEGRLKMEVLMGNEIDASSSENLKSMEFRKVKCKGVFDEKKSILVLEDKATDSDPFAYEYSLLTPLTLLPPHPQSGYATALVNRGRVPRDWADYMKIEKFQSLEMVRDFPQKERLSSVSSPRPQPVEFVGVIRSGVCSEWLGISVGTVVRAVGLDPEATLYVEQIEDMSDDSCGSTNTVATPYRVADILGHFSVMKKEHLQMMIIWYCCSGGSLYLARWLMRKSL